MTRRVSSALQFKITLADIRPVIWRRIQVPEHYTFWDLHVTIQDAMGWKDCHLHAFHIADPSTDKSGARMTIGIPLDDPFLDAPNLEPGWTIRIADVFTEQNRNARYVYDFGDDWDHDVDLEDMLPRKARTRYPRCIAGANACPPEDCGGVPGYELLRRILADPTHDQHSEKLAWVGRSFKPEDFNPRRVRFDDPAKRWERAFRSSI